MTLKSFLKLVEIQTKAASVLPFLLGTVYTVYRFNVFIFKNFILMFISLLCIDMATTAVNNYMDFKRANKKYGYGYESHNAIPHYNLSEMEVVITIFILLISAIISGFILFIETNFVVLILGAVSFAVGILYSFGPVPISRTPFGEAFSGLFMGNLIPFIAVYIHVYNKNLLSLTFYGKVLTANINILEIIYIIMISAPAAVGIANIMLANNICDIDDDIENRRYTLPIYLGRDTSLVIFKSLYYIGYTLLVIAIFMKAAPWFSIITVSTLFMVEKNIRTFYEKQSKKDTFVLAVKNFVVINTILVSTMAIALFFK